MLNQLGRPTLVRIVFLVFYLWVKRRGKEVAEMKAINNAEQGHISCLILAQAIQYHIKIITRRWERGLPFFKIITYSCTIGTPIFSLGLKKVKYINLFWNANSFDIKRSYITRCYNCKRLKAGRVAQAARKSFATWKIICRLFWYNFILGSSFH